jgi:hypothetical protein
MKAKIVVLIGILLSIINFTSCNDDEKLRPIELKDIDGAAIIIRFNSETPAYSYALQGGDGNYKIESENKEVVTAEMISSVDFRLEAKSIGETTVTIMDNSQNILTLSVSVEYESHNFVITSHDVFIVGDDLTGNEKKAIREKQLAEIPIKTGGGYEFIFTDYKAGKGKAILYPEKFGSNGIETTFQQQRLNTEGSEATTWGYEVVINDEKRLFVMNKYSPSTRDMFVPIALYEDVTSNVQVEYPKAESVITAQVIEVK